MGVFSRSLSLYIEKSYGYLVLFTCLNAILIHRRYFTDPAVMNCLNVQCTLFEIHKLLKYLCCILLFIMLYRIGTCIKLSAIDIIIISALFIPFTKVMCLVCAH